MPFKTCAHPRNVQMVFILKISGVAITSLCLCRTYYFQTLKSEVMSQPYVSKLSEIQCAKLRNERGRLLSHVILR